MTKKESVNEFSDIKREEFGHNICFIKSGAATLEDLKETTGALKKAIGEERMSLLIIHDDRSMTEEKLAEIMPLFQQARKIKFESVDFKGAAFSKLSEEETLTEKEIYFSNSTDKNKPITRISKEEQRARGEFAGHLIGRMSR